MPAFSEEGIYTWFATVRTKILAPLARVLAAVGITPDMVSYAGGLVMIGFVFVIPSDPQTALWLLLFMLFLDMLDGSLARTMKIDSDRGKFTDVVMDALNFALFITGVVYAELLSGAVAVTLVHFMLLSKILLIVKKNLGKKTDWIIHPVAGAFPNIFVFLLYGLFAGWVFGMPNLLGEVAMISTFCLVIKAGADYRTMRAVILKN